MTKKRGLGRGLGALIPSSAQESEESGLQQAPVDAIRPNPHQPRSGMDEVALDELATSIREHGLIQPLIVQDGGDNRFTLIAGERRWRAAQRAGLKEVPVIVKEATPQAMLEMALIENVQRADLNALEEAAAYRQLMDEFGLTQEEVSRRVGKSRSAVANTVRLLNLPAQIQQAVVDGQISSAHARTILALPTPEAQIAMMKTVINLGLNVRRTESAVQKLLAGRKPLAKPQQRLAPELAALESQFQQSLGTKVNIRPSRQGGQVVIHYYSDEELQAIYEAIVGE